MHVRYCTTRCGYCDFDTYTAAELGGPVPARLGGLLGGYPSLALAKIEFARKVLAKKNTARTPRCKPCSSAAGRPP